LAFFATDGLTALFATFATSHQMANALSGIVLGVLSLFNGFTANRLNMPVWLYWIQYLSPFYWRGFVIGCP
jgi:ABC-type multidrug transport system permease subunit